jgi:hypothetical protein
MIEQYEVGALLGLHHRCLGGYLSIFWLHAPDLMTGRGLRGLSLLVIALFSVGSAAYANQEYALNRVASTRHGVAYSVVVLDGLACVTGNDGVSVFDVSDPSQPRRVTTLELGDGAFDLQFVGSTAYVAGDEEGLFIVDFSDPGSPIILGVLNDGGTAFDVNVEGDVVYLADITKGLEVVDVSDPGEPVKLSEYMLSDARAVRARGEVVYLGNPSQGVVMLDASDPGNPTRIGVVAGSAPVIDINLSGDYMLLSCHGSGLKVYDISDPRNPSHVGSYVEPGGEAYCVEMHQDRLYVADLQRGGLLLDFSDPSSIKKLSGYGNAAPHDLVYSDGYIFMACEDGLVILEYGPGQEAPGTGYADYVLPAAAVLALLIGVLVYRKTSSA